MKMLRERTLYEKDRFAWAMMKAIKYAPKQHKRILWDMLDNVQKTMLREFAND